MANRLVHNATETGWFRCLMDEAVAVCFPAGRVKFWSPGRIGAPLQGQAVIGIGVERELFCKTFGGYGACLIKPRRFRPT